MKIFIFIAIACTSSVIALAENALKHVYLASKDNCAILLNMNSNELRYALFSELSIPDEAIVLLEHSTDGHYKLNVTPLGKGRWELILERRNAIVMVSRSGVVTFRYSDLPSVDWATFLSSEQFQSKTRALTLTQVIAAIEKWEERLKKGP